MSKAAAADLPCLLVVVTTTYAVFVIQNLATEHLLVRIASQRKAESHLGLGRG